MLNLLAQVSEGVFDEADIALRLVSDEPDNGVWKASREFEDSGFSDVGRNRYAHSTGRPHPALRQPCLAVGLLVAGDPAARALDVSCLDERIRAAVQVLGVAWTVTRTPAVDLAELA